LITGHFRDESFRATDYTDTNDQTHKNHESIHTKTKRHDRLREYAYDYVNSRGTQYSKSKKLNYLSLNSMQSLDTRKEHSKNK